MAERSLEERVRDLEAQLEEKLDAKLKPIRTDLAAIKHAVTAILSGHRNNNSQGR